MDAPPGAPAEAPPEAPSVAPSDAPADACQLAAPEAADGDEDDEPEAASSASPPWLHPVSTSAPATTSGASPLRILWFMFSPNAEGGPSGHPV